MEGNATKFEEKITDGNDLQTEAYSLDSKQDDPDTKARKKSIHELSKEEETLQTHLDKLKKENFTLQASISAWEATLQAKLDEFKEADLKLDEIHNEIWSQRERFCSRADEFNEEYGLPSEWWAAQMEFVSDLEQLEKRCLENRKCKQEIERLEEEVGELKREMEELRGRRLVTEAEVHATADEIRPPVREDDSPQGREDVKKVKFQGMCSVREPTTEDLYSIVDLDTLRMVNRNRNRHRKNLKAKKNDAN